MIKTKVAFLGGRLLSCQSEQFKKFSKSSDWLEKSQFCFDYVNRAIYQSYFLCSKYSSSQFCVR